MSLEEFLLGRAQLSRRGELGRDSLAQAEQWTFYARNDERTTVGNLGKYQAMTTIAKKVGGPVVLWGITFVSGYVVLRPAEAGMKAGVKKAIREMKKRNSPCATKGQIFRATSVGAESGLKVQVGDEYRVLECDGDAILIEVLGDPDSPYFVSSQFLRSVSDFPQNDVEESE